jgi:peptide/nickel transport system permease protein
MSAGRGSAGYLLRRVVQAVPVLLAIIVLNFLLLHLAPGDAADVLAGEAGSATPEYMRQLRTRFGLDAPLPVRLLLYVKNVLSLDLGFSFRHNMPVLQLILARLGPTLLLMGATLVVSVTVGVVLGLLAATRVHGWRDTLISIVALVGYATPLFWVGLMLIVVSRCSPAGVARPRCSRGCRARQAP